MPALSDKREQLLYGVIDDLAKRVINATVTPKVTHAHLLDLFVKPEDHDAVKKARKLFRHTAGGEFLVQTPFKLEGVGDFTLRIKSSEAKNKKPFMHPYYMGSELYATEEHEGYQAMMAWLKARYEVGRQWGMVRAVLQDLNAKCTTSAQMRFFWPGIATLAGKHPDLQDFADRLRDANTPSSIPKIHPTLREACKTTMQTLTMGALLSKDLKEREPEPVELEISQRPPIKRPWGGTGTMPFL
jgi:hypothetical protein